MKATLLNEGYIVECRLHCLMYATLLNVGYTVERERDVGGKVV